MPLVPVHRRPALHAAGRADRPLGQGPVALRPTDRQQSHGIEPRAMKDTEERSETAHRAMRARKKRARPSAPSTPPVRPTGRPDRVEVRPARCSATPHAGRPFRERPAVTGCRSRRPGVNSDRPLSRALYDRAGHAEGRQCAVPAVLSVRARFCRAAVAPGRCARAGDHCGPVPEEGGRPPGGAARAGARPACRTWSRGAARHAILRRAGARRARLLHDPADPRDDMALLHFTSGTTGAPMGAVHVHEAVVAHYATAAYALDLHPGACTGALPIPAGSLACRTASSPHWCTA